MSASAIAEAMLFAAGLCIGGAITCVGVAAFFIWIFKEKE